MGAAGRKRITIGLGFLSGYIFDSYSSGIFKSVQAACGEAGLNFIGFEGGFSRIRATGRYNKQKYAVIDLIDKCNLNGMILLAEHASNTMTDAEIKTLYRNLAGMPIISIGPSPKAAASVLIDNRRSMRELVTHLLCDHGCRRIAFLNGPDTSQDGRQRFEAYRETLRRHGVAVNDSLIVPNGDFYSSGADAVKTLLDQRRADFDAIVAANDSMAIFAIKELERRGIRVPDDVAVVGFDDFEAARQLTPGLTTIRQSFYDIGRESVKAMRAILAGEGVPRRIVLPTRLIVRESCGCADAERLDRIRSRGGRPGAKKRRTERRDPAGRASRLADQLDHMMPSLFEKPGVRPAVEHMARALPGGGDETGRRTFLTRSGAVFERLFELKEDAEVVCRFIVSFFQAAAGLCEDPARQDLLGALREDALMLLASLPARTHQSGEKARITAKEDSALVLNDDFLNLLNLDQLKKNILLQLPKMQFKRFYVCLYTDPTRRNAKLLMQYHSGAGARPLPDQSPFPAKQLVPGLLRNKGGCAYMVAAIFFEETDFGYMLFDITNLAVEPVYDDFAAQISGAINSAMQAKAIHEYAGQLEVKVKERTRQLELAARERADLFNEIAHEIKNPLTLISNYLDAYIAKQGPSEELGVLKSKFDAILEVMIEYLSREKTERGKILYRHDQVSDFSGIVRNDAMLFRESARRKDIRLEVAVEPGVFVAVDPEALERVVENLLHNAVRFTKPGGGITVSLARKGNRVEFSVQDTGIGLAPGQLKHIFERYYQANAAGEGSTGIGLGLDIVKKILDEIGADIRVASTEGKGSTFTCGFPPAGSPARVRVPLMSRAVTPAALASNPDTAREERGNVLFVEDNAELLGYLIENTKEVFNVYQASNGLDALAKLDDIPKPNLIVSDVLMDHMDGHRLFEELMKHDYYRDVPFIFLTAVNTRMDRLKALNQGAVDYITKPFRIDELVAKIRSTLRIQEALKKNNILRLGGQLYQAIEEQVHKSRIRLSGNGSDEINQLFVKHGISRKEIEIISLLKVGLLHKEIAVRLDISIYTVRTHIARIYKKLNVKSPLELFAKLKSL